MLPPGKVRLVCQWCRNPFVCFRSEAERRRHCSRSCHSATNGGGNLGRVNPALAATRSPTALDIGVAAGIYEGDGTCAYNGRSILVRVGQKDPELLWRFKRDFGGSVTLRGARSGWQVYGARAHGFLLTIFKFLTSRRKAQALRAIRAQLTSRANRRRLPRSRRPAARG